MRTSARISDREKLTPLGRSHYGCTKYRERPGFPTPAASGLDCLLRKPETPFGRPVLHAFDAQPSETLGCGDRGYPLSRDFMRSIPNSSVGPILITSLR